ncbi:unnamed protein product [Auanema sp. JU1783]|nr:unnamed protein product [Auanema sp. JU1783]
MNRERPFLQVPPYNDAADDASELEPPMDPYSEDVQLPSGGKASTSSKKSRKARFDPYRRCLSLGNSPHYLDFTEDLDELEEDRRVYHLEELPSNVPGTQEFDINEINPPSTQPKTTKIIIINAPSEPRRANTCCYHHHCPYAPVNTLSLPSDIPPPALVSNRAPFHPPAESPRRILPQLSNSLFQCAPDLLNQFQPSPFSLDVRNTPFPVPQYQGANYHSNLLQTHCHTMPISTHFLIPLCGSLLAHAIGPYPYLHPL